MTPAAQSHRCIRAPGPARPEQPGSAMDPDPMRQCSAPDAPPLREHAGGGMLTCRNIPAGGRPFTSASGLSRKNASCLECGSLMLFLRSLGACMRRDFAISDRCAGPIRPTRCSRVQRSLGVGAPCLEDWRASAGSRSQLRDFRSHSHLQTRIPCARYRRPRPLAVTVHQPKAAVPNAIR